MGKMWMDQYSLLHFAVGIVAYFWGLSFWMTVLLHIVFEYVENTTQGMWVINEYVTMWPGGKPYADSIRNRIGDTLFSALGWLVAAWLNKLGEQWGWYKSTQ